MSGEESDYWKRLNQTIKGMERAIYKKEVEERLGEKSARLK